MIAKVANWILGRIEITLALPLLASLICLILYRLGALRSRITNAIYLVAALSSAAGYAFAFSATMTPLINMYLITPEVFILLAMAFIVGARTLLSKTYRAPSPWWVALVIVIGHGWTRVWIYALGGDSA
jgi:hypothetical protein